MTIKLPQSCRPMLALRHSFTRADYHAMLDAGILHEDDRVELFDGQIIQKFPTGPAHASTICRMNHRFSGLVSDWFIVSVKNPVALNRFSEPEPDLALLRRRDDFYAKSHPTPQDIALIVEVADTSLGFDREDKVPLYSMCGIPEVWIVDLPTKSVHVFRQPGAINYSEVFRLRGDDKLAIPGLPDAQVTVRELAL